MLVFESLPKQEAAPGLVCRWNSAFNPYTFLARRRDYEVISVMDMTTFHRLYLDNNPAKHYTASVAVGDTIYISSQHITGTATIDAINSTGAIFKIDVSGLDVKTGGSAGGFCNVDARTNYHAEIRLLDDDGLTIGSAKYNNNIDGEIRCTVQSLLRMDKDNASDYSLACYADRNLSKLFAFQFRENDAILTGTFYGLGNDFFAVNGAKQFGDAYDSNYLDFNPFETSTSPKMKFLTKFDRPTFFPGYPFDVSFIFSERLSATNVIAREDERDINGSLLQSTEMSIDKTYQDSKPITGVVNRLQLNEGYDSTVTQVRLHLYRSAAASVPGSIRNVGVDPFLLAAGEFNISEKLDIDVGSPCYENATFLCWLNELGGWDYWLFHTNYTRKINVRASESHRKPIFDLSQDAVEDQHVRTSLREYVIGANNLTLQQVEGIEGLLDSLKVYKMETDGSKQTVKVQTGSFTIRDTASSLHKIELKITLPERFNQSL